MKPLFKSDTFDPSLDMVATSHENKNNCECPIIEMVDAPHLQYQILNQFVGINHRHQNGNVSMTTVAKKYKKYNGYICKYWKLRNRLEINRICSEYMLHGHNTNETAVEIKNNNCYKSQNRQYGLNVLKINETSLFGEK